MGGKVEVGGRSESCRARARGEVVEARRLLMW